MGAREEAAAYWSSRADKERQWAETSPNRGEASHHKRLAARYLDLAHSFQREARQASPGTPTS
jgi:hypothetical protein